MTINPSKPPKILAIANQKGGVGKTTTCINLGAALAVAGERVVILDLDPQGNASTGLGISANDRSPSSFDFIVAGASAEHPWESFLRPTSVPDLFVLPAHDDLLMLDSALKDRDAPALCLREALASTSANTATCIFLDCPPGLSLGTLNALAAADELIVPLQCEFLALEGLTQLIRTMEEVRNGLNPTLEISGVILTMFDGRNKLAQQVAADARGHFGALVFDEMIPRNVRLSEAPSHGLPALVYDHRAPGAQAYIRVAGELLRRMRTTQPISQSA